MMRGATGTPSDGGRAGIKGYGMADTVLQKARSATRVLTADVRLGLKNLFLPAFCRKCGVRILTEDNLYFCADCWSTIETVTEPKCPRCGRPHSIRAGFDPIESFTCSECSAQKLWFDNTYAAGIHAGVLRDAIHLLKYGRKRLIAAPLARLALEQALAGIGVEAYDFITTVPLHRNRAKERGYNQSELIARHVCEGLPGAEFSQLLRRVKDTPSFSQLGAIERRAQIRRAFRFSGDVSVKKKSVLLIDDVVTTGATTNECARILKRAGAKTVDVLAVAVARRLQ